MMSKICNQCNLEKILEDFPNSKSGKYGKLAQCKSCDKINQHNQTAKIYLGTQRRRLYRGNQLIIDTQ